MSHVESVFVFWAQMWRERNIGGRLSVVFRDYDYWHKGAKTEKPLLGGFGIPSIDDKLDVMFPNRYFGQKGKTGCQSTDSGN